MIKRIAFGLLLNVAFFNVYSQKTIGVAIGYNYSNLIRPLHNLEIPAYEFNIMNPQYEKKYEIPQYGRGITVDFLSGDLNIGAVLISFSNKHGIAEAKGTPAGSDTVYLRQLKYRFNTLGVGGFVRIYEFIGCGFTFDGGTFKVFRKIAPENDFKNTDWEKFYEKGGMFASVTPFVQFTIVKHLFIRAFYQGPAILFTKDGDKKYYYNVSTFGVSASLFLGMYN